MPISRRKGLRWTAINFRPTGTQNTRLPPAIEKSEETSKQPNPCTFGYMLHQDNLHRTFEIRTALATRIQVHASDDSAENDNEVVDPPAA